MTLPMIGIMTSPMSESTIFPKAPPMMTPTAISTTLPFSANSLNSFNIYGLPPHLVLNDAAPESGAR